MELVSKSGALARSGYRSHGDEGVFHKREVKQNKTQQKEHQRIKQFGFTGRELFPCCYFHMLSERRPFKTEQALTD